MATVSEKISSLKNSSTPGSITPLVLSAILEDLAAIDPRYASQCSALSSRISSIEGTDSASTIDTIREVKNFLAGIPQSKTLKPYLDNVDALLTRLAKLETAYADTKVNVSVIDQLARTSSGTQIDTLQEVYDFLQGFSQSEKLSTLKALVTDNASRIESIEGVDDDQSARIDTISADLRQVKSDIGDISSDVDKAVSKVDELSASLQSLASRVQNGLSLARFEGFVESADVENDSKMIPTLSEKGVYFIRSEKIFAALASDGKYYENFSNAAAFNTSRVVESMGGLVTTKKITRPDTLFVCGSDLWIFSHDDDDLRLTGRRIFSEVKNATASLMRLGDIIDETSGDDRRIGIVTAVSEVVAGSSYNVVASNGRRYLQWLTRNSKITFSSGTYASEEQISDLDARVTGVTSRVAAVEPVSYSSVTADNISKIKAGDKVNGGLVVFANNSSVEVKSTGGGSWYYKNGSDVNRYDHSGLFWGASVSSDNYLSGIWAMMPIGVVTDDNFNLGVLYGTDSRESGGCYVLRERTVTRYQTVYDNGQYRGVPEAEFRIPRIWPAFTSASLASLRDFSKFSVGDIVGGCIVIAVYSKILRTLSSSGVEIFEYNLTSKKARIFNWGYEISESSFSDLPDILSPGPVSPLGDDNN